MADESCADGEIVRALEMAGHDVRLASTDMGGADDEVLVAAALAQDRVLITKDRDFGRLVFARGLPTPGVIYVRWPVVARHDLPARLVTLVTEMGDRLGGAFVVLRPSRVRVRRGHAP